MKRFTLLLAIATLGLSFAASAYDIDPGSADSRRWYGGIEFSRPYFSGTALKPLYYRPTMRYYGNGFTVNYRYIPVFEGADPQGGAMGLSSNFRTEAFHISTDGVPSWGADSPRLTVKDPRSAAPRTAVTSIVRKKTSKSTKTAPDAVPTDAPAITPSTSPAPDAAPAPPKP